MWRSFSQKGEVQNLLFLPFGGAGNHCPIDSCLHFPSLLVFERQHRLLFSCPAVPGLSAVSLHMTSQFDSCPLPGRSRGRGRSAKHPQPHRTDDCRLNGYAPSLESIKMCPCAPGAHGGGAKKLRPYPCVNKGLCLSPEFSHYARKCAPHFAYLYGRKMRSRLGRQLIRKATMLH